MVTGLGWDHNISEVGIYLMSGNTVLLSLNLLAVKLRENIKCSYLLGFSLTDEPASLEQLIRDEGPRRRPRSMRLSGCLAVWLFGT